VKLPNFDSIDSDGRSYCEITLPGGTFRMFEDRPYVWTQILKPGDKPIIQAIEGAYFSGALKK
jgi:hypothetical protein